jgi:hypothetical protein
MSRFLAGPASVRHAAGLIALSTTLVVIGSGILMRVLDRSEYPSIGRGVWWASHHANELTAVLKGLGQVGDEDRGRPRRNGHHPPWVIFGWLIPLG